MWQLDFERHAFQLFRRFQKRTIGRPILKHVLHLWWIQNGKLHYASLNVFAESMFSVRQIQDQQVFRLQATGFDLVSCGTLIDAQNLAVTD